MRGSWPASLRSFWHFATFELRQRWRAGLRSFWHFAHVTFELRQHWHDGFHVAYSNATGIDAAASAGGAATDAAADAASADAGDAAIYAADDADDAAIDGTAHAAATASDAAGNAGDAAGDAVNAAIDADDGNAAWSCSIYAAWYASTDVTTGHAAVAAAVHDGATTVIGAAASRLERANLQRSCWQHKPLPRGLLRGLVVN